MPHDKQPRIVPERLVQPAVGPQHYLPPTPRDLRSQAVHRLQVGLFGLAAMLLMVGLANIIMDRARLSEPDSITPDSTLGIVTPKKPAGDPLADIGVIPAADPTASPAVPRHPQ